MPQLLIPKKQKMTCCMKISNIFKTNTKKKKNVLYSTGDWHAKARSQEIPRIKGKFGLEVWNEAGQMVTEFCQENTLVTANNFSHQHETDLHVDIDQWSILKSDWLCSLQLKMEKLCTVSKNKRQSWLWLRSWTPYYKIQA